MNPIRLAISQPITVAVGIVLTMLAGYLAFTGVPVELAPEIQKGVISVSTAYPNANPTQVENDVLIRQEDVLRELSGLDQITSTANRGQGQIRIELKTGIDPQRALTEVDQLISRVPGYPPNVLRPVIRAEDPESNDFIAWVMVAVLDDQGRTLEGVNIQELYDFVDAQVAPRLQRIIGISQVNVLGGRERELQVRVDPEALARRGMTMSQLVAAIEQSNQDFSGGAVSRGSYDVAIRVPARWTSEQQARDTVLRQDPSGPVYLSDVAEVREDFRKANSFIRSRGVPVLAMNFQRELGSNVLQVMRSLQAEMEAMNAENGLLDQFARERGIEGSLRLRQVFDQTIYVEQAIGMVRNNLLLGAAIAVVVLLLFLRSLRSVGIVALAIPTSVLGASIAMIALGRTVNVVSLAGAAFAIGLVVDNSIVVLENIYRHLEMGKSPVRAAYDGTREVALAVLASTLTTVVVFTPVLLIEQQVGQLFRDLAIAICSAVLISYVVSIVVIPSAAALLLKPREPGGVPHGRNKVTRALADAFEKFNVFGVVPRFIAATVDRVNRSILARVGVVGVSLALVTAGVFVLLPPFDYLPSGNRNIVFGVVIPPPGYNLDKLSELAEIVQEEMRPAFVAGQRVVDDGVPLDEAQREVPELTAPLGRNGEMLTLRPPPMENYFIVGRADADTIFHGAVSLDDTRVPDLQPLFGQATADLPGTIAFNFQPPIFRLGGGSGAAVNIDIIGRDIGEVQRAASALFPALIGNFGRVQPKPSNFNINGPELTVLPDSLRASDVGLTERDVGLNAQALADGIILRDAYQFPDELRDVNILSLDEGTLLNGPITENGDADTPYDVGSSTGNTSLNRLAQAAVATPSGAVVSLSDVATLRETVAPTTIRRVAGERAVTLEVTAASGVPLATAINDIQAVIDNLRDRGDIPDTVQVDIAGTADALSEIRETLLGDGTLLSTLGSSVVVALVVVYLLMCVLFQSWSYPFVIMLTVPLATFGGFVGLWLVNLWTANDRLIPTTNLDVLAMLGFIVLSGTVVNNAILIVEQTNNFLKMGRGELQEAGVAVEGDRLEPRQAVTEAVRSRVRPIFMSMTTSVGGMLPLVLIPGSGTELYRGLGAVIIGGLFVSTLFTLFVTPAMLSLVMDLKQKFGMRVRPKDDVFAADEQPRPIGDTPHDAKPRGVVTAYPAKAVMA